MNLVSVLMGGDSNHALDRLHPCANRCREYIFCPSITAANSSGKYRGNHLDTRDLVPRRHGSERREHSQGESCAPVGPVPDGLPLSNACRSPTTSLAHTTHTSRDLTHISRRRQHTDRTRLARPSRRKTTGCSPAAVSGSSR
jgi:hypothetical protein